ncbi:MAG: (2Fe-2S) ferredoxin domain-containing protein [Candidatus Treponema excrementipullorum]|uniref:(2Fe-2S) ferredoxin domain-containing protein n=1 Tax=Candidatus Treponema excrementipullorum TaxID=2838768 RepID=A0A9E2L1M6_9SPIR|nr:(2Fe-2S) ferredoxin domain-containing protein [Candidatus Treponema excrementipullorum]MCI6480427.1 (2Fe-2S) ferredoxin domain-containing protein [Spirochaetia bacterium]MCI6954091.1 (2Fe-2S) ferredoxin domain-containing protein [Spirochaetia bacterium]MCI7588770.1 (2Fe-2S) ferredoxin domain-containing protein [Spirochaetia bacterium]MDD7012581.1 (2Fe-2S) ferredoxin domain-containing protein [Candidatus Treponema excrementipullorum]
MKTITICMGSSCFTKGNGDNAEFIQNYLAMHYPGETIEIRGCLCEGECKKGPNIRVGDKLYTEVSLEMLPDIIEEAVRSE